MLSRLSIPIRLLLLIAVPLAALLIVGLAGLASINATGTTTRELEHRQQQQLRLDDAREQLQAGFRQPLEGVLMQQLDVKTAIAQLSAARQAFERSTKSYFDARTNTRRERTDIQPVVENMLRHFDSAQEALLDEDMNALRSMIAGKATDVHSETLVALTTAINAERELTTRLLSASRERGDSFFALNAVLGFAGLALALVFGYYIGRSITAPVRQITETVEAVTAGDMQARSHLDGYDEITVLGDALDKLLDEKVATLARAEEENSRLNDSVIALLRAVSRLSQRDLTVRVPVTEDVTGPVADAINQLATETGRVLIDVSRVADQVAIASSQVKTKAESVNAVAHTQQHEALDTAEKLTHASERLTEIARLAEQCNELARRAAQNTESAVSTVTGTLQGMTDIREVIQETGKRIKRLGERSQEISGIVDIINKIAERTTVLALNASMQAAAAGDAGRGFGVVADEVQRLAESTRNAAGQIGTLIKSMQVETNDTIGTMENAIGQVVEGSKLAEVAGKQIGETQSATTALVLSVQRIAASSQEQAQLSQTLRDRARAMMNGVRTTGDELRDQLQETLHLTDFSRRLLESVRVFKLPSEREAA